MFTQKQIRCYSLIQILAKNKKTAKNLVIIKSGNYTFFHLFCDNI